MRIYGAQLHAIEPARADEQLSICYRWSPGAISLAQLFVPREVVGVLCVQTKQNKRNRVQCGQRRTRTGSPAPTEESEDSNTKGKRTSLMRVGLGDNWRSSSLREHHGNLSTKAGEALHPSDASASGANPGGGLRLCRRRHLPLACNSCSSLARECSSRRIPCGGSARAIPLLLPSLLFLHLPLPP